MRRSKAEVERYIASLQSSSSSPREKAIKGFFFAKLYFEAKEYELAKRYVSAYLNVQERDPKAHKFLGQLYESDGNVDKAVGCYKRSVDLNPTQKDLILKIAELLCDKGTTDGRAEYWLDRAAKLFPGSPVIYKLKEQLLRSKGEIGWNQLFDLIQSELFARPDDVYINIKLVELYQSNEKLEEAVNHCLKVQKKGMLQNSLEWFSCVVQIFKEYLESAQGSRSEKSNWRTINRELLLAHSNCVRLTLSSRNVQESRRALENFDHALQFLKPYVNDSDELSITFLEMRGHFYMHTGTLLLKAAQVGDMHWRAVTEMATLCYLIAFQVPKPKTKSVKGDDNNQDLFEMLAFDRQSQAGHMLLNLSLGKQDFFKEVVETFANKSGQNDLLDALCESQESMEWSFLSSDDIRNVDTRTLEVAELIRYDNGAIRLHSGNLQHLTWLGLQWHSLASLPAFRKWLKQLFPRLPQETARLDTNAPESICIIDLEVFLLAVVFSSHLQLQDTFNIHHNLDQPRFLPLPLCKQLCTEKQKSWWDAIYNLIHKKAQSGNSATLRLIVQHGLTTLRAQEKHGLQPAVLIHWTRSLHKTVSSLNSFYDQRDYMGRCVYYWKKILPVMEMIKKRRSVPEPTDPLFKHFHSRDIQVSQVKAYEDEAQIAFATLDLIDGKTEDAIQAFEAIKNVNSYWNLALIFQRKSEDLKSDPISPEEHEEYKNCLRKCKMYLMKIMDEDASDDTVDAKLLVSIETGREMLDSVMQELGEYGDGSPFFGSDVFRAVNSDVKHSTPSPTKFSMSPNKGYKFSPKTPPHWAEDQKSLLQILCHQVEALKNEVQELKLSSGSNVSHRWPNEGFGTDTITDSYQGAQNFQGAPLTVSTSGPSVYYSQSPAYNSQYLLRPAANGTPTKAPVYGMNRLGPQQHVYSYQPQMHTSPLQNTSACMFPQEIYGAPLRFESPTAALVSPRGEDYYNYSVPQTTTNPSLPEPGYFTKPSVGPQVSKTADLKNIEFGKPRFGHSVLPEGVKSSSFTTSTQIAPSTFKFNSNFKSNDGDFTFSSPQVGCRNTKFTGSERLLGLLTSDSPLQDQEQNVQKTPVDKATDHRSIFSFGSKAVSADIKKESRTEAGSEDVIIVYELTPTPEQKALAESLHLPKTFFCYKNRPDYVSEEEEDDEDFETAVKKLNGRLYPDDLPNCRTLQYPTTGHEGEAGGAYDAECIVIWEKRPIPEEKDISSSTDKVGTSNVETSIPSFCKSEEPDSTNYFTEEPQITSKAADRPVDLSTKSEHCDPDSTTQGLENVPFSFGFGSASEISFADLASNSSGDFSFGRKDENFKWANTGATVFGSHVTSNGDENDDDDDTVNNDDIHFEPIVSLPEVEVQSGEEDEEILFKERAKLYRWDREVNQWKERGVGEIKILFHSERQYYRVLMRRDQVLKVCANHLISTTMEIKPLNTSNNALTWFATDYTDGEAKCEHLAVKFKTEQLMDSFKKTFEECQKNLLELQNVS
uniref:E3 SUMO-protein ligase RanBP2-like isoform X4 n=1 Tax=Geotrypetes seraphini TaxID=260995 RepID=A0A6P8R407_GEOSA|nr:E3 SUMO-protein ligase RanBP2-like isoform X4 [Geotrypetes seraphini]